MKLLSIFLCLFITGCAQTVWVEPLGMKVTYHENGIFHTAEVIGHSYSKNAIQLDDGKWISSPNIVIPGVSDKAWGRGEANICVKKHE